MGRVSGLESKVDTLEKNNHELKQNQESMQKEIDTLKTFIKNLDKD